ncbi:MAG TPA: hypothetical protein VMA34_07860 [Terracidiphilus sp.]|nr:hypothetical protein [Terracidiphilus sp.]
MLLLKFLLRRMSWTSFAVGAAASVVGPSLVHPMLVSTFKLSQGAASVAQDAWGRASTELARARNAAAAPKSAGSSPSSDAFLSELRALRDDLAAVKAKVGIA